MATVTTDPITTWPSISLSGVLTVLSDAITNLVLPNIVYIVGAVALVGAVSWVIHKASRSVRLRG